MKKITGLKALLPSGFSDNLYPKSERISNLVEKIINYFSNYSYLRVNPPLIEFEDTLLSKGPGTSLKENTFRIMDPDSKKMMALRPDMTTQISRIASSRMLHYPRPLRISYSGDVLRVKPSSLNMERQITQVGAEIIGNVNQDLESEIILITLDIFQSLNIKHLSIDLNFPILRKELLKNISKNASKQIIQCIEKKDLNTLEKIKFNNKSEIINLMRSSGIFYSSKKYLNSLTKKNQTNQYILQLTKIAEKIKQFNQTVNIIIDPLEKNSFNYHDGLTFTIFSKGIRSGLAKGGTYKTIIDEKATGVSIYIESLNRLDGFKKIKSKILLKNIDFNEAKKFIQKDYKVLFTNEKKYEKLVEIAKSMECEYIFFKQEIKKVE